MKKIKYAFMLTMMCFVNSAEAKSLTAHLSQDNMSFTKRLEMGEVLEVRYDLKKSPVTRVDNWRNYAVFCFSYGKATVDYSDNGVEKTIKVPLLASTLEHDQSKKLLNIDPVGKLIIHGQSEFYSGAMLTCGLYPKYGD
tara:strand:+ start:213 stop:629 length:417 start_codon:yes stop_codon:yes gene_type:complete